MTTNTLIKRNEQLRMDLRTLSDKFSLIIGHLIKGYEVKSGEIIDPPRVLYIKQLCGKYNGIVSSDEFIREKQKEIVLEK